MKAERSDAHPTWLIRKRLEGGRLREFVYPADGSEPVERRADVALPGGLSRRDASGWPGQLLSRDPRRDDADLPIRVPPLRSGCQGTGGCCGLFHHIPVLAEERDALLATVGQDWQGFVPLEDLVHRAFEGSDDRSFNIATAGGSCAFIREDGLCGPHAQSGFLAKPLVCRSFPCTIVLCGDEWHASLRPECACIARTAVEGPELQADVAPWSDFLSSLLQVQTVPDPLCVQGSRLLPRTEYASWVRRTVDQLATSDEPIATLRSAARELGVGSNTVPLDGRPPQAWFDRVVAWLTEAEDMLGEAYDPRSPYRLTVAWARKVALAVAEGAQPDGPEWSPEQRSDWSRRTAVAAALLVHGHGLLEAPELGPAAVDLGHLLWLAREANAVQPAEELDARLESTTSWLFLWRTVGRSGNEPPLSFSFDEEPCLGASGPLQPGT